MRTEQHYRDMFARHPETGVDPKLAAAAVYAARHGVWDGTSSDELAALTRSLAAKHGDTLSSADVLAAMDAAQDTTTTTYLLKLSARERVDLDVLAGEQSSAEYIRGLIAADAQARGLLWHSDIQGRGVRGAGRRKR